MASDLAFCGMGSEKLCCADSGAIAGSDVKGCCDTKGYASSRGRVLTFDLGSVLVAGPFPSNPPVVEECGIDDWYSWVSAVKGSCCLAIS